MVACSHALLLFRLTGVQAKIGAGLGMFGSGWAGVTLFFVLSGLVLGMAIRRIESDVSTGLLRYAVRRVFRIYPAVLFSTIALLVWLYFGAELFPGISKWLDQPCLGSHGSVLNHRSPLTLSLAIRNLLMLESSLNLVTWTLKVEMVCSLLLPALHYAVRSLSTSGKLLVLLGLIWLACLGKSLLLFGYAQAEAFLDGTIIKYVFLFYLGYLLPEAGPFLTSKMKGNFSSTGAVLVVGIILFFGAGTLKFGAFSDDLRIVQGFGGALILASVLYGAPLKSLTVLDHPVIKFYGRISYSFYLLHDLVLIIVFRAFIYKAPLELWRPYPLAWVAVLWVVSMVFASGIAWLSFSRIERPFIEMSKRICLRIAPILINSRCVGAREGAAG